jgi:hypothetical protein
VTPEVPDSRVPWHHLLKFGSTSSEKVVPWSRRGPSPRPSRHPPSAGPFGSLYKLKKLGGGHWQMCTQNPHLRDSRQHPAHDRACCTHTAGYYPRCPDLRPIGTPIQVPVPGRIGTRKRGISRFPFPAESGIGNSLPVSRPNRESGDGNCQWGFPGVKAQISSRSGKSTFPPAPGRLIKNATIT